MTSFCNYFNLNQCRSCEWIEIDYADQIRAKEAKVRELFRCTLESSVLSPLQGFRNKVKMSVTGTLQNPVIGMLGKENLDQGQALLSCPIQHPRINQVLAAMPEWIREARLIPYQIQNRSGELKGLIIFYSEASREMYLRFVLRSRECVSRLQKILPKIQGAFSELVCISANIQPIPHAILEGPEEILLTERNSICHRLGEMELSLAPQAFVQTNTAVAIRLYQTAAEWIAELGANQKIKMAELFCGQGAFSFFAAQSVSEAVGMELSPHAVETANATAGRMNLKNLRFICLDVNLPGDSPLEKELKSLNPEVVLVNPPRRGLGQAVRAIERTLPRHLIYSSCSAESLASDANKLLSHYEIKRTQVFDLFPHTEHFEVLMWFTLKEKQT